MDRRRALRACAVTVICAVLGLLAGTGPASAHAVLISTEPGQGVVVATMPTAVTLSFSEPVALTADGIRVFGPTGARLDDGRSRQLGDPRTVGVGLPAGDRPEGTYTVSWRVVSADSHPVAGAFTFSVGHPSPARGPAVAQPSAGVGVSYAIIRAAAFAAYALLVGSIAFVLLCWPGVITSRQVRRVMLAGWAGLLATTMATLLLQGPYANGLGLDRLLDSEIIAQTVAGRSGTALSARLMLLALAGGYLVLLCAWLGQLGRRGRVWFGALGVVLAAGLAATWAATGHAAVGPQASLALPVDVVHLLAMGGWLGGLVTLQVVLRETDTPEGTMPARAVHRFSTIATGAIVVLIGTGAYQSWRQLGSWAAFGSTDYGRLLLVKLGVVALMLSVAASSHRWVIRHRQTLIGVGAARLTVGSNTTETVLGRNVLRRSVLAEAALGTLVLGATALLVNAEPGRTATTSPSGPVHQVISYDTGGPNGRGRLTVDLDPATTGPNTIRIVVEDSIGSRRDVAELRTTLTLRSRALGPFAAPLQQLSRQDSGPGSYQANAVALPYPGTWELRITVRTSEIDQTTVTIPVEIS